MPGKSHFAERVRQRPRRYFFVAKKRKLSRTVTGTRPQVGIDRRHAHVEITISIDIGHLDVAAELCQAWEAATRPAAQMGIRVVHLRTGLVLTPAGGALGTMLLPFKIGVGGRIGSGRQYVSWIDHDDLLSLILHVIRTPSIRGAVNATAPYAVPNSTFTGTLGRVLERPTLLPLPGLALSLNR